MSLYFNKSFSIALIKNIFFLNILWTALNENISVYYLLAEVPGVSQGFKNICLPNL